MSRWRAWIVVAAIPVGGLARVVVAAPDYWDSRLNQVCGLYLQDKSSSVPAGQGHWRLTRGEFEDESQSGGNHHIYYKCLDVDGNPIENQKVWASWAYTNETGWASQFTKGPFDGYWGNFGLYASCPPGACNWPYNGYVDETGSPRGYVGASDKVWGMGMHNPNGTVCGAHVNFRLTWRWTIKSGTPPTIARSPTSLAATAPQGTNPANQTFTAWSSGGGTLNFTVTTNQPSYLSLSPGGGSSTGATDVKTINVIYTVASLPPGTYNATITIADGNASNNPVQIPVAVTIASTVGTITGTVRDTANNPLSGALVQTTTGGYSGTTNTAGSYTLSGVAIGTYTVQASKSGYITGQQAGVQVSGGQVATANFTLASSLAQSDFDADSDVDLTDFSLFQLCFNGPNRVPGVFCLSDADFDSDGDVDLMDFGTFQGCFNGPNRPPAC